MEAIQQLDPDEALHLSIHQFTYVAQDYGHVIEFLVLHLKQYLTSYYFPNLLNDCTSDRRISRVLLK